MRPLWAWAALCACGGERLEVITPPALEASTRAVVIAIEWRGALEVHARPADASGIELGPIELELDDGEPLRVDALEYDRALDQLGLPEGRLTPSSADTAEPLPEPRAHHQLDQRGGEALGAWRESVERSKALDALRIDRERDCVDFEVRLQRPPTRVQPSVVVEIEPGLALFGNDEAFFTVSATATTLLPNPVRREFRSAFSPAPGRVWLGARDGALRGVSVRPTLSFDALVYTESRDDVLWLSGAPGEDTVDIFALTEDGILEHFDGTTSRVVHRMGASSMDVQTGGLAWVAPREAVIAWFSERGLTRVRFDGAAWVVTTEPAPGATAAFISIAYNPRFGPVAGNSDGQFFKHDGAAWVEVGRSPLRVFAFTVAPYRDGFVYGSAFGNFGEYSATGYCPFERPTVATDIRDIATLSTGAIVLFGPVGNASPGYAWLEPRR